MSRVTGATGVGVGPAAGRCNRDRRWCPRRLEQRQCTGMHGITDAIRGAKMRWSMQEIEMLADHQDRDGQPLRSGVHEHNPSAVVDFQNRVRRRFQKLAKSPDTFEIPGAAVCHRTHKMQKLKNRTRASASPMRSI